MASGKSNTPMLLVSAELKPLGDAEVKEKFISLAADVISEKKAIRTIDLVWKLEDLKDIRAFAFFPRE